MVTISRFDVWLVELNPTKGSEINKVRPCLIVSPEETNKYLKTVIIVPLTSTIKPYPTRVNCTFQDRKGQLVIDQIRTVDKSRLLEKIGQMDEPTNEQVCNQIIEMFKFI